MSNIPDKWHLCDGTNGTPDLRDGRFLEGSSNAGNKKSAGLPNITSGSGVLKYLLGNSGDSENHSGNFGAFIETKLNVTSIYNAGLHSDLAAYKSDDTGRYCFDFDASRCSPIYKNDCTTVQPASYTVLYIMKIKA